MAPAHIPVFLFQKPGTKNGIIQHACNLILRVGARSSPRSVLRVLEIYLQLLLGVAVRGNLRRFAPAEHQVHKLLCLSASPIVITFKSIFWLSLESLLYGMYYFSAFAKKTSRARVILHQGFYYT